MTFTFLCIGLLILIPLALGVAYLVRISKEKRVVPLEPSPPTKADPVPLDRNPEMPHRPGATS